MLNVTYNKRPEMDKQIFMFVTYAVEAYLKKYPINIQHNKILIIGGMELLLLGAVCVGLMEKICQIVSKYVTYLTTQRITLY